MFEKPHNFPFLAAFLPTLFLLLGLIILHLFNKLIKIALVVQELKHFLKHFLTPKSSSIKVFSQKNIAKNVLVP
jgi:hypothetical protein